MNAPTLGAKEEVRSGRREPHVFGMQSAASSVLKETLSIESVYWRCHAQQSQCDEGRCNRLHAVASFLAPQRICCSAAERSDG
jgi:hypothetical protein